MCAFFFSPSTPSHSTPFPFSQLASIRIGCGKYFVFFFTWSFWFDSFCLPFGLAVSLSVCHCLSSFFFCDRRRMKMTETWIVIVRYPSRFDSLCLCADENIYTFSLNFDFLLNWWKNLISSHGSILTWMNVDWSPTFIFWMVFVHVWEKHILPQFERNFWLCKFAFWIYRVVICHLSIVICHFLVLRVSQCLFLDTWNSLLISFANFVC